MRSRKNERGQALAELTASLIGMCFIMIGVLAVSGLGMVGVRNAIATREQVDQYSLQGEKHGEGRLKSVGGDVEPGPFLEELKSNSGDFATYKLASRDYSEQMLNTRVSETNLFLSAADLTLERKVQTDPLAVFQHFDAERILRALGVISPGFSFFIVDRLVMPLNDIRSQP